MKLWCARCWVVLALLLAWPLHAQTASPSLNLNNADLRAFIHDVGRATGTTFVVDPQVQGTVTLHNERDLSDAELIGILLATLRANGLIAVPAGSGVYRVVPDVGAAQQARSMGVGAQGYATQVFALRHVDAAAAVEALKPLVGRGGVVLPVPQGNAVLVADYADNLARLRQLIGQIDQDRSRTESVRLRNSSAREIAAVVQQIYSVGGALVVAPVESSNAIMLRGDPAQVANVRRVVEDLDRESGAASDVRVIRLQHASADELLPVLQQVVGQQDAHAAATAPAVTGPTLSTGASLSGEGGAAAAPVDAPAALGATLDLGPGRRARVARYPGANAIIINADPDTQRMLVDVIQQLDTRREQVLVEALVVEMSDDAARRLGTQLMIGGKDGSNVPFLGTHYPGPNRPGILQLATGAALAREGDRSSGPVVDAARALLQYNGGLAGLAGETSDLVFGMIIDAVKNDTASNLISTPSVLTLDNAEARILVGQEVPITTGEVLGSANLNAFRTIDRQDVGVQLVVRPQINAGGGITLRLRQEVSAIAGAVSDASPELILNKREVETSVLADDGAIVVLGGLLDQSDRDAVTKVPGLGDLPIVGGLFRTTARSRTRTNLMVFIRPSIVRDRLDAQAITAPRFAHIRRQQLARPGVTRAQVDALVEDYFRTAPPAMPERRQPAPASVLPAVPAAPPQP